ncbi:MAG TPA: hypothetical protein VFQ97_00300 [Gallionella sp.]|nr:hypothetical protein [Gallionella sp.]
MTPQQKRKLEKLSKALEEALAAIRELLQEQNTDAEQKSQPEFDARTFLASLKVIDRTAAEEQLGAMKQHELGAILVESGGPSSDKKKPKVWLIEQILWRVFDFERGHEAIRSKGVGENNTSFQGALRDKTA